MKKIFSIIAMSLALLSCGGNENNANGFKMYAIGLDEAEKELAVNELKVNDELFIGEFSEVYTVLPNSTFMVCKIEEGALPASNDRLMAGALFMALIQMSGLEHPEIDCKGFNDCELEEYQILNVQFLGVARPYGDSVYSYMLDTTGRERSYIQYSHVKQVADESINLGAEIYNEIAPGGSESEKYIAYSLFSVLNGDAQNYLTAFTHELSNGTKVRVICMTLSKKYIQ